MPTTQKKKQKTKEPAFTQADVLRLAAEGEVSPKTARRALELGADALRAQVDRDRVGFAARRLGLKLGHGAS